MKNKIILAVLLVLCFIPSAVAAVSYRQTQNAPVDEKTAVLLSIDDLNEKRYTFRRSDGEEADNMIRFFLAMRENASPLTALPDSLRGSGFFKVTLATNVKEETYKFYFSQDPAANYFENPQGLAFKITEADAANFITTEYAECIYASSAMPVLTLSGTNTVLPDQAAWQYKNYTGSFVDADVSAQVAAETEDYSLEGGFDLSFDTQPDYFSLKITDKNDNVLYDDVYTDLRNTLQFDSNTRLRVHALAQWYEDPSRSFCGELQYDFTCVVTAPAEFYIPRDSVQPGGFVAVTATNILSPEKIQFTCSPEIGFAPTFYTEADGEYAVALIPFDASLTPGSYVMTFVYGGTTQNIHITVSEKTFGQSSVTVSNSVLNLYRTSATVSAFEKKAAELMAVSEKERYFSGSFLEGIDGASTLLRGFGREIILNNDSANTYRNNGVDYQAATGVNVVAANRGKVVFANVMDYTGYMVVIDHGYGLKTWYYNMGSIAVSEGDIVDKGAVIGTCGQTGFTTMSGVHTAMSVGSKFVCPYDTWADSDKYGKVVIWGVDP